MENFFKKNKKYFWIIIFVFALKAWADILFRDDTRYLPAIIVSLLAYYFWNKANDTVDKGEKKKLSEEEANAIANKIKFEAEQHRKNRDSYNYIKKAYHEEE